MDGISASLPSHAESVDGARDVSVPYVSLVVTARNDDHGGNLLGRMQVFVNAWIGQCKTHQLRSELIIVEWNPPADRPRLIDALAWPSDPGPCQVRIIGVPPHIHARYSHAEALPLYQMIAKNVGIRRACAKFVLATNIDIVFSDELVQHLADGRLETGRMYRIDRHDVMSEVPVDGTLDEQLAYCQTHLLRLNAREGTFNLTSCGLRAPCPEDIVEVGCGIVFGKGWFPVERHRSNECFRWVDDEAELQLTPPSTSLHVPLMLEIEPGPGVKGESLVLEVLDEDRMTLAEAIIERHAELSLSLQPNGPPTRTVYLRVIGGGRPSEHDPRSLNVRVFRCEWGKQLPTAPSDVCQLKVDHPGSLKNGMGAPTDLKRSHPFIRFYREAGALLPAIKRGVIWFLRQRALVARAPKGMDIFQPGAGIVPGTGWYAEEHYLGETFRWIRNEAQLIVTPSAGEKSLLGLQIEPGPGVDHAEFELLVRNQSGAIVARATVRKLEFLAIPIPRLPTEVEVFTLGLDGGDLPTSDEPRILNFRVFWCGWVDKTGRPEMPDIPAPDISAASLQHEMKSGLKTRAESEKTAESSDARPAKAAFLHTNGCGDFTLMAREHWFDLRGYPEFDLFSMNLDSVLCYAAHHAGVREEILQEPMRIYHIEHRTGSGWTPEGQARLFERIAAKGLSFVDYPQVVRWINDMRRFNSPIIFNLENWGLADLELTEQVVESRSQARAAD